MTNATYARRVTRHAYAKINLYLDILSRRADGFHDLLTVMHSLSLHDDVSVEIFPCGEKQISLRVYGARLPVDQKNLAYRAAEAFLAAIGQNARVHVNIRKKLPIAAGLAGGSSDAAATLRAIAELFGNPLSEDNMLALGAALGSDVPYCMVGGTQICRGRGELMQPLALSEPLYAVVATAHGERVSTPRAFAETDTYYNNFDGSVPHGADFDRLCRALADGTLGENADCLYNAFEPVVLPTCTGAADLRERMLALGAYAAHMSGSGPSVFGLFKTHDQTLDAARALGPFAYVATSAKL
ncbi:MAG: 4-(cytidine 5'-diphospho)-2-C-methyl-D-erythritol kinase [Clostridia bacterium]|nr:4-(cytidine 5'-diphospho)-2-C-methyl-D-erythritol kinase [Clostridia bacterium]